MTRPAFLISGPPASGKTTLAGVTARRLDAALLDLDVVTGALTEAIGAVLGTADLDSPAFAGHLRTARYECLLATAEDNLRIGRAVVLVAPFTAERTDPTAWANTKKRLETAGGQPVLVWLRLTPDELVRRLHARNAARDAAKLADTGAFLAKHSLAAPAVPHLAVDATEDVDAQLARVLSARS